MRVLLVYYEPHPSGQTAHVLSLAQGLDRQRYALTVVLPEHLGGCVAAFKAIGVSVVPLPMRKVLWPPRTLSTLYRLIRDLDVDVVHVHSQEAGLVARVVAWLARSRPVLYTPQTIDIRRTEWHWLYARVERLLALGTDAIVSVTESDRARLIRWGIPSRKVFVIPNGIDLSRFEAAPDVASLRRELGLESQEPLVLQVGRLSAQKDPLSFVEGAAEVVRSCPHVHLGLIGEGPLRQQVQMRISQLGLEGQVHLAGWHDRAWRFMPAADVVTLTSRWEGLPYVLLEAMAWSRPVVATAVNGCPEIVADGETGFLVRPGDAQAWAGRVVELLQNPVDASAMGRRGRTRIEEKFTLQQMVAEIGDLYQHLAATRLEL